jgi:hypothetical protein
MVSLRGQVEVDGIDIGTVIHLLCERFDFNGEIRAAEFAHPASDADLGPFRKDFAVPENKKLFRAEGNADAATLAVLFPDDVEVAFFLF